MKRIRINNDFIFAWAIERNGLPEDLSTAINMVLKVRNSAGAIQVITDYDVTGNIVSVEVTPEIANVLGRYVFILTYELPDVGLSDLERMCEVDTDAFVIVPRTAEADDAEDLLVTSDMAIGFKGDSAYQIWLDAGNAGTVEDYLASLKGNTGTGIQSIVLTSTVGLVKTYTITLTDGTTSTFSVEDGVGLDGKSAYQIWLDLGNVGTEQDFINSLASGGIDLSAYLTELEAQGLYQPIGNYLTAETDPTVPAWAKAATKPTYTAAEVGAAETGHTHTDLHTHSNKAVLDATTASFTLADESKLDGLSNYTHPATHSISEVSGLQTALDNKVDDSQVLTNVPAGALFTDTVYTHPATHEATIITQDATHRFVTDTEKATWSGKADASHTHDDRYYTETEIDTMIGNIETLLAAL